MKYDAVIFDLGGTLMHQSSWSEQVDYIRRMAAILQAPPDDFESMWRAMYRDRQTGTFQSTQECLRHICGELGVTVEDSRIESACSIPNNITKRQIMAPREGAIEVLSWLRMHGCKTGLLSNWSGHVTTIWNDSPLAPLVDVAVFSCSVGLMKPDARIFRITAERLNRAPEKCLYVADGMDEELKAAAGIGMQAVMLYILGENDNDPYREKWDGPVISSLKEVLDLVE